MQLQLLSQHRTLQMFWSLLVTVGLDRERRKHRCALCIRLRDGRCNVLSTPALIIVDKTHLAYGAATKPVGGCCGSPLVL